MNLTLPKLAHTPKSPINNTSWSVPACPVGRAHKPLLKNGTSVIPLAPFMQGLYTDFGITVKGDSNRMIFLPWSSCWRSTISSGITPARDDTEGLHLPAYLHRPLRETMNGGKFVQCGPKNELCIVILNGAKRNEWILVFGRTPTVLK